MGLLFTGTITASIANWGSYSSSPIKFHGLKVAEVMWDMMKRDLKCFHRPSWYGSSVLIMRTEGNRREREFCGVSAEGTNWSLTVRFTSQLKRDRGCPGTQVLHGWHWITQPLFCTLGKHMLCEFHTKILPVSHWEVMWFFLTHQWIWYKFMSNFVFPRYMTCYGMGIPKDVWIIRSLILQCQIYAFRSLFIHLRNVSSYTPLKDAVTNGDKYFNDCETLSY